MSDLDAIFDMITYYRQNETLIRQVVDDMIKEVAPQPDDDPAEVFASIVAIFARDRDRAAVASAAALMRLSEILPPGSPDNPVYVAGYEQGRSDYLISRKGGYARRGDAVEAWIKHHRDQYAERRKLARTIAATTGRSETSVNSQLWGWDNNIHQPDLASIPIVLDALGYDLALIPRKDTP